MHWQYSSNSARVVSPSSRQGEEREVVSMCVAQRRTQAKVKKGRRSRTFAGDVVPARTGGKTRSRGKACRWRNLNQAKERLEPAV